MIDRYIQLSVKTKTGRVSAQVECSIDQLMRMVAPDIRPAALAYFSVIIKPTKLDTNGDLITLLLNFARQNLLSIDPKKEASLATRLQDYSITSTYQKVNLTLAA